MQIALSDIRYANNLRGRSHAKNVPTHTSIQEQSSHPLIIVSFRKAHTDITII